MHPPSHAKQSWGGAFYFLPYSESYKVTTVAVFKVTMFTAHMSSN